MAHELDSTNGTTMFASARKPAWHRLGTVMDAEMTVDQALDAAHLGGWNVRLETLQSVVPDADGVHVFDVPAHRASVRTNPVTGRPEVLGVVGAGYTPIQNEQHAEFLAALTDASGGFIETAGALRGGRQVFVTCKLPEAMTVGGVDQLDLYLAVLNAHDGSAAFRAIVTPVRVVCANTQAAALNRARQSWSIRHTVNATRAVTEARDTLRLAWSYTTEFQAEAERMIQATLTDDRFEAIVAKLYGAPGDDDTRRTANHKIERLQVIRGLYHDAATQAGIRGTRWAAFQAIGEYEDHFSAVKATGVDAKADRRALRAVDGAGVGRKNLAFGLLRVPA